MDLKKNTAVFLLASASAISSSCAMAALEICNNSNENVFTSIAYSKGSGNYIIEGWWEVESNGCYTIIPEIGNRYYYIYADSDNYEWSGDFGFCVNPFDPFEYVMPEDQTDSLISCKKQGIGNKVLSFREIDIGESVNFVYELN